MTQWKEVKDGRMKYERSNPQTYSWTEAGWDSDKYRKGWDEIFGKKDKKRSDEAEGGNAEEDGGQTGSAA
jgi:hypothetical protein